MAGRTWGAEQKQKRAKKLSLNPIFFFFFLSIANRGNIKIVKKGSCERRAKRLISDSEASSSSLKKMKSFFCASMSICEFLLWKSSELRQSSSNNNDSKGSQMRNLHTTEIYESRVEKEGVEKERKTKVSL